MLSLDVRVFATELVLVDEMSHFLHAVYLVYFIHIFRRHFSYSAFTISAVQVSLTLIHTCSDRQ